MGLFHRKSAWQQALEQARQLTNLKSLTKSGLATAVGLAGITAASAVASSVRNRSDRR